MHGWFVDRGGEGEEALRALLGGSQPDPGPTLEERAARFGVSPEILGQYEAAARRRLGQPPASVASVLRTAAAKRSTRYTNPWWFARLEQLARALFAARDAHFRPPHPLARERPRREEIVLGTLPGVNVRADVMPAVRGQYRIILVDETVFVFSFQSGKLTHMPSWWSRLIWNETTDRTMMWLGPNHGAPEPKPVARSLACPKAGESTRPRRPASATIGRKFPSEDL